jgi:adenylate cyclase
METLLKNPEALRLGGERREVTVMMTDLRGFSAIAERHSPEAVVEMLNHYFEFMIEIVHRHNGTIIEFLGDGLLVIFGAPIQDPRHRLNACRCALEMQGQCMAEINRQNHKAGRPQLEMGAGLHCGESVIGNLGSLKRAKYSVVGSVVNLTARIESYTSGGQILLSPQMTENCGDQLQLGKELEVYPKGFAEPLRLTELHGIKDEPQGWLKPAAIELRELQEPIPIRYQRLDGKHIQGDPLPAQLLAIGPLYARMAKTQALAPLEQIQFKLNEPDHLRHIDLYARVSACEDGANLIRLAPMPEEVRRYLQERA